MKRIVGILLAGALLLGTSVICLGMGEKSTTNQESTGAEEPVEKGRKILVIGIIEENWDNIEMGFGKKKVTRMTKQEYMKYNYPKIFTGKEILDKFKKEVRPETSLFIFHRITYLKNFDVLSDTDVINWNIGRTGDLYFTCQFVTPPRKIPIAKPKLGARHKGYEDQVWGEFRNVRFVKDVEIINIDKSGNIKFKYLNKEYYCPARNKIELPIQENTMPSTKFVWDNPRGLDKKTIKKAVKKHGKFLYGNKYGLRRNIVLGRDLYPDQKVKYFYIRTKITIVNYGYVKF